MSQTFGHEKLIVYQKAMRFIPMRHELLERLPQRVAACDHLNRASESIVINIAHASNSLSSKGRIVYLGHANGSALECAACLDILIAKTLIACVDINPAKHLLAEIVSMLIAMHKTTANKVCEHDVQYRTKNGNLFSHEDLAVYQVALQFIAWLNPLLTTSKCSADLLAKLDKSTTAIMLNLAEGSGRFTGMNQSNFYKIAHKATIQSAALLDLAVCAQSEAGESAEKGREQLRRISGMLASLTRAATNAHYT